MPALPEILELAIHNATTDGRGVARTAEGVTTFVARALPGETVRAELLARSRGVIHARVEQVLSPSPERREPDCPAYATCDGCQWLHAHEAAEYSLVEAELRRQIERLAQLPLPEPLPAIRLPRAQSRDRLTLQLARDGTLYWLGPDVATGTARARYSPWTDTGTGCPVAHRDLEPLGRAIQRALHQHWNRSLQQEIDNARHAGHVPHVILARGPDGAYASLAWGNAPLARLLDPQMQACALWISQTHSAPVNPLPWYGATLCHDPRGFFQPSLAGATALAQVLRDWTQGAHFATLYDIYGGQGLWAYALADRSDRAHIIDASGYRSSSAPSTWRWQRSDLGRETLSSAEAFGGAAPGVSDLVIVDPPRAGLSPALIAALNASGATRLLYVSCGPDALGRDLKRLHNQGRWQPQRWQVVHQFPGSGHAELVVELFR